MGLLADSPDLGAPAHEVARRLAAYLPLTLVRDILAGRELEPGASHELTGAVLFADVSGFTAMVEELALDGPRGAEEVNRVLLSTFTVMIDIVHQLGGVVARFMGDAMLILFPEEDGLAAGRALACGQAMLREMAVRFQMVTVNRPPERSPDFAMTIKIGGGYGACREIIVGSGSGQLEYILTGPAVTGATAAEKRAGSGQLIATDALLAAAGQPAGRPYTPFSGRLSVARRPQAIAWEACHEAACRRLANVAARFVAPGLARRLSAAAAAGLADHRPVTNLFVQFSLAETGHADAGWRHWQPYYQWAAEIVSRYGGRLGDRHGHINHALTGDKGNELHVLFGAPVAPDTPDQAARCALALQRERPAYVSQQRIGMAAGKVFAGPVGAAVRCDYTAVGDVVNLSARLAEACADGEVLTTRETAARCGPELQFESLDAIRVRGRQTDVIPCRIVGDRLVSGVAGYLDPATRPLVGRDEELARLDQVAAAARSRRSGLVAVFGGPGVGKTRLLVEAARRWQAAGGAVLVGICQPHTTDTPYHPWRTVWQDFFGLQATLAPAEQAAQVHAQTRALLPDAGNDVQLWDEVLGLSSREFAPQMVPEARRARFFTLAQRCLRQRARQQPLLLVLENIHWADRASLALVDHLAQEVADAPLLVAMTYRPDALENRPVALDLTRCARLPLSELTSSHARLLLQLRVGSAELPLAIEQQLGLRDREGRDSRVNPLFLEEALNVLLEAGVLTRNGYLVTHRERLGEVQLPDTIHGLLLARLDRLSPAGRDLLQVASVIGRQFELDALHGLAPQLPVTDMRRLLEELSAVEITRPISSEPKPVYAFQHAMTHEVAYASLPFARRQALHAGLARWLEKAHAANPRPPHAILAYHYSRAGAHGRAGHFAWLAGDDALAMFANAEAADHYRLAERHLEAGGAEPARASRTALYYSRAQALRFLGELGEAVADARRAQSLAETAGDELGALQAQTLLAELRYRQGHFGPALEAAQRAAAAWHDGHPSDELALALLWAGMAAGNLMQPEQALTYLRQAENLCLAAGSNARLARVLEAIAYVHFSQQQLADALAAMQESVALSRDFSIPASMASALNNIALIQSQLGQPEAALQTLDEAIFLIQDASRSFLARFLGNRAEVLTYLGQFGRAEDDFGRARTLFQETDDDIGLVELLLVQGWEYYVSVANWDGVDDCFAVADGLMAGRSGDHVEKAARLELGQSLLALQQGATDEAGRRLARASQLVQETGLRWWVPAVTFVSGLHALAEGELALARRHWRETTAAVDEGGCPDYRPLALLALARSAPGHAAPPERLAQIVEAATARARFLDRLYCLRWAGEQLARQSAARWRQLGEATTARALAEAQPQTGPLRPWAGELFGAAD